MSQNILITGGSGYLGGTLLACWKDADLPPYKKAFAAVRTEQQAEQIKNYNLIPIILDMEDESIVRKAIIDNEITTIFFLVDALGSRKQVIMIEALAEVKEKLGREVHFLHTTGAKMFSSHVGHPTNKPLLDTDPKVYDIQKESRGPFNIMNQALQTNNIVIETSENHGVRSYIFVPCIVYGEGRGFGNKISIQTVAIVQAAKALRRVYKTRSDNPTWPVCHVIDNAALYLQILCHILADEEIGFGKQGYYLASPGSVAWDDLYSAIAKALAKRNVVDDEHVKEADGEALQKMGQALKCNPDIVPVLLSGCCTFTGVHGKEIGWKPQFEAKHILGAAEAEVELILKHMKG
ncbi:NAD(P)-binding protein [Lojkania enalia]|uniref:NAD(P)-binding protein n=1 Tax=Lojkania enalia TaxID=147567 RepID=A0A9P4MUC8_9PLEO|nr:NAD(P)-binding protein [Didymosphaeria enalia]